MSTEADQIFQQWESRSCPKCPCKSSTVVDGDDGKYRRCHDCKHVWNWIERDAQSRLVATVEAVEKAFDDCPIEAMEGELNPGWVYHIEMKKESTLAFRAMHSALNALRAAVEERGKV